MKNSTKTIKAILDVWPGPVLVTTKNTDALAELKQAGIKGMHRNQEPVKFTNLKGYDRDTVVIKIFNGEQNGKT